MAAGGVGFRGAEVRLTGVGLRFPGSDRGVLEGVDLVLGAGEMTAVVGPSGCGKSTLLRLIAGLLSPTSGEIAFSGGGGSRGGRGGGASIGFVFQDATLLPWRTVVRNVRLPLELGRASLEGAEARIGELLELAGLSREHWGKRPHELSGGMRMRVSLARALVSEPSVLLFDEPFGALDDMLRRQLNRDLASIQARSGWTGVFVTHNVEEAVYLGRRVVVMGANPGRIAGEVATPGPWPRRGDAAEAEALLAARVEVEGLLRGLSSVEAAGGAG